MLVLMFGVLANPQRHQHDPPMAPRKCRGRVKRASIKRSDADRDRGSPFDYWENEYCERANGTLRHECLDHLLILNERHLCDVLREYVAYYNEARTHTSLERNAPEPRERLPESWQLVASRVLGGLHLSSRR